MWTFWSATWLPETGWRTWRWPRTAFIQQPASILPNSWWAYWILDIAKQLVSISDWMLSLGLSHIRWGEVQDRTWTWCLEVDEGCSHHDGPPILRLASLGSGVTLTWLLNGPLTRWQHGSGLVTSINWMILASKSSLWFLGVAKPQPYLHHFARRFGESGRAASWSAFGPVCPCTGALFFKQILYFTIWLQS